MGAVLEELARQFEQPQTGKQTYAVFNSAPQALSGVTEVEIDPENANELRVRHEDGYVLSQLTPTGKIAFVAQDVPAYGWRVFTVESSATSSSSEAVNVALDGDTAQLLSERVQATFSRDGDGTWDLAQLEIDGQSVLGGSSLLWHVFADSGGLYRIGSEMSECASAQFELTRTIRPDSLTVLEQGPARATLRLSTPAPAPLVLEVSLGARDTRLRLTATGSAAADTTVALSIRPKDPAQEIRMEIAGGVATRALSHLYVPAFWPAVGWFAGGSTVVHLGQSTGVHGSASGDLMWMVFRNARTELPCDNVGPEGTDNAAQTLLFALGRSGGPAANAAGAMSLSRPLRSVRGSGAENAMAERGALFSVVGEDVLVSRAKLADRGTGVVLHLQKPNPPATDVTIAPSAISWSAVSRCDLLERDDERLPAAAGGAATFAVDQSVSSIRLQQD